MKQKNSKDGYVTKKYLDERLDITKKYLDERLDKRFSAFAESIRAEIRFAMEEIITSVKVEITKFKDEILTTVDPLLQELETRQQEREIASNQAMEFQQQVDNHEKRIKRLEQVRQAA